MAEVKKDNTTNTRELEKPNTEKNVKMIKTRGSMSFNDKFSIDVIEINIWKCGHQKVYVSIELWVLQAEIILEKNQKSVTKDRNFMFLWNHQWKSKDV